MKGNVLIFVSLCGLLCWNHVVFMHVDNQDLQDILREYYNRHHDDFMDDNQDPEDILRKDDNQDLEDILRKDDNQDLEDILREDDNQDHDDLIPEDDNQDHDDLIPEDDNQDHDDLIPEDDNQGHDDMIPEDDNQGYDDMIPEDDKQDHDDLIPEDDNQGFYDNIPLSMVEESVDDMYFGCHGAMMKMVQGKYFEERYLSSDIELAWNEADDCADMREALLQEKYLTKDHLRAICLYTYDMIYNVFNQAVRSKRSVYTSSFQFYYLHFMLTSAIQSLNNNNYCHTTYRRSRKRFTGQINQTIRFGSFASSSYKPYLVHFGNETCFKIRTCSGAFLKHYAFFDYEVEVLIPPYEMFNITDVIEGQEEMPVRGFESCKVVYILESAGMKSNLNCKLVNTVW